MEHSRDKAKADKRAKWLATRGTDPRAKMGVRVYDSERGPAIRLPNGAYASLWDLVRVAREAKK
jgi:hypothetical protein